MLDKWKTVPCGTKVPTSIIFRLPGHFGTTESKPKKLEGQGTRLHLSVNYLNCPI